MADITSKDISSMRPVWFLPVAGETHIHLSTGRPGNSVRMGQGFQGRISRHSRVITKGRRKKNIKKQADRNKKKNPDIRRHKADTKRKRAAVAAPS